MQYKTEVHAIYMICLDWSGRNKLNEPNEQLASYRFATFQPFLTTHPSLR